MQKSVSDTTAANVPGYRERVSPSLWFFAAALVCAPMVSLTLLPGGTAIALIVGVIVAVLIIVALVFSAPIVTVEKGHLRAGRARIDVSLLGEPRYYVGDDARHARGPGLSARAWHLIRAGVDGIVVIPIQDQDDPVTEWVISTRTPDRLIAAIHRAQRESGSVL